ncbi:hypothetical protein ACFL6B_06200, partial [Thermodesulfobacteriota bacterium]
LGIDDDRSGDLAERFYGSAICPASAPCGIGGMGCRSEGCFDTFFGFLSMAFYIRYVRKKQFVSYLLSMLLLCLGLMAKPMLATLSFVLGLLDFWLLCRFDREGDFPAQLGVQAGIDGGQVLRLVLE